MLLPTISHMAAASHMEISLTQINIRLIMLPVHMGHRNKINTLYLLKIKIKMLMYKIIISLINWEGNYNNILHPIRIKISSKL